MTSWRVLNSASFLRTRRQLPITDQKSLKRQREAWLGPHAAVRAHPALSRAREKRRGWEGAPAPGGPFKSPQGNNCRTARNDDDFGSKNYSSSCCWLISTPVQVIWHCRLLRRIKSLSMLQWKLITSYSISMENRINRILWGRLPFDRSCPWCWKVNPEQQVPLYAQRKETSLSCGKTKQATRTEVAYWREAERPVLSC